MIRCLFSFFILAGVLHAELTSEQKLVPVEQWPTDRAKAKVVLIAGSVSNKPGQHEYFAGCTLLMDWLKNQSDVAPVLVANGWPQNDSQLDGARSILFFLDGGAKLPFLEPARLARIQALAQAGCGFVVLHQAIDCPPERAADFKNWFGAAFQPDIGCRGHWDVKIDTITPHLVTRGITPFELLKDGWLYNLHFAEKGVTPLLQAAMPDSSRKTENAKAHSGRAETIAWAYERPDGGRSIGFTGCDLHANWSAPQQRLLILNSLLWTAKLDVPKAGLASKVTADQLKKNWDRKVFLPKKPKAKITPPAPK